MMMVKKIVDFQFCLAILILLGVATHYTWAWAEYTQDDFWWLAGEADTEHATFAPSDMIEITRDFSVRIKTIAPKRYVVGNEPVQVRYRVFMPFSVRIDTERYRQDVLPFRIIALQVGERRAVQKVRDLEVQEVTITVSLTQEHGYGTYTLPALQVPYEYILMTDGGQNTIQKVAVAESVDLQKVPIYLDVLHTHTIGAIGDPFVFSLEIHKDDRVEVLNEYPFDEHKRGVSYLSAYDPKTPFIVLKQARSHSAAENYQVIRWHYTVAVHDIDAKAFELAMPQVIWQKVPHEILPEKRSKEDGREQEILEDRGAANSQARGPFTIDPDPLFIQVRSITRGSDKYQPLKGIFIDPDDERSVLFSVPLVSMWLLSGAAFLWALGFIFCGPLALVYNMYED